MLRIALFAFGAVVALYLIWNGIQMVLGLYNDRKAKKSK
jgi:hypothetical protein